MKPAAFRCASASTILLRYSHAFAAFATPWKIDPENPTIEEVREMIEEAVAEAELEVTDDAAAGQPQQVAN